MEYFLFFLLALFCEILGTLGGFGSSFLFVPLMSFFFEMPLVLMLTGILHVFSNIAKLLLFRKFIDFKIFLRFGIPSLLLTIVGAFLTGYIAMLYAQWLLALLLVAFSILFLIKPRLEFPPTKISAFISGSLAGFFAGFTGTGGAIRGISLAAYNLEKNAFVATSAAIDFGVDFSRTIIYFKNEFFDMAYIWHIPVLFVASFAGSYAGKLLLNKIPQHVFKKIVLIIILVMGVSMLYRLLM